MVSFACRSSLSGVIAVHTCKDGNEMRLEMFDGDLSNVAAVVVRLHKFELVRLANKLLHVV